MVLPLARWLDATCEYRPAGMPYHEQAYGWRVCRDAVAISMAMAAERNAVQLYLDRIGQALMEHHIRKK